MFPPFTKNFLITLVNYQTNRDRDDCFKGDLIIWNNMQRCHYRRKIFVLETPGASLGYILPVRDLLKNTGKYLSYEEFKTKYNIEVNSSIIAKFSLQFPKVLKIKSYDY